VPALSACSDRGTLVEPTRGFAAPRDPRLDLLDPGAPGIIAICAAGGPASFTVTVTPAIGTLLGGGSFSLAAGTCGNAWVADPTNFATTQITVTQTSPNFLSIDATAVPPEGLPFMTVDQANKTVTWSTNPAHGGSATFNQSPPPPPPPACTDAGVTISNTSWNKFTVPGGTSPVVWVHAHIGKPSGISTTSKSTLSFTGGTLTLNATSYSLPDGRLTFDPAAAAVPTTTYNSGANRWETVINPKNLSDEIFFTGAAIPVTPDIAAGAKATFSYDLSADVKNFSFSWQWSAAVYTFWPADWNQALILPYHNGDHAGTPENTTVQKSLIQGPRGGGGSNYTGSWSATGNATCS
jgi:hypothetical protein